MFDIVVAVSTCLLIFGFIYISQEKKQVSINLLLLLVFGTSIGATSETPIISLLYLIILLYIILINPKQSNGLLACRWLLLYLAWMVIGLSYSSSLVKGIGMILKFLTPLLFYTAVYKSLKTQKDIDYFVEKIYFMMPFCLLLGVVGAILNNYAIAQVFFSMTTIMIPFILFNTKRKDKKYIYLIIFCIIPPLLYAKRTPLLGITLIFVSILFVRYRTRAIIPALVLSALLILSVFYIPFLKEKFFFDTDVTVQDLKQGLNLYGNINTNGRSTFWKYVLDEIYSKNKFIGIGTGSLKHWIQSPSNTYNHSFQLTHNDLLLMLCEGGLVGVSIFALSVLAMLRKCIHYSESANKKVRVQSYACLGMTVATVCHMFFENCVNTFGFCMLYVYFAMFCKQVTIYKREVKQNHPITSEASYYRIGNTRHMKNRRHAMGRLDLTTDKSDSTHIRISL